MGLIAMQSLVVFAKMKIYLANVEKLKIGVKN